MASHEVAIKLALTGAKDVVQGLRDVGDAASLSSTTLDSKLGRSLAGLKTAFAGLATGAAAAVSLLGKSAVSAYAAYEQNIGGIQTLFAGAEGKMLSYAQQAYQTAGLSANAYMEQVTSFSAALLQGLGGDTSLAADIANQAMVDMSDNVNKFGSDFASIQYAYQGFAKQNYTMLDNLKLGYGGTAKEMARLINDSGVLGDTMKVTESTVNSVSFDTIIKAIHQVQENLGVAGTTIEESSKTLSGSFNTLKGAWANLMTGLADPSADVTKLSDQVVDSLSNVVTNLTPVIKQIGQSLSQIDFSGIATTLVPAILSAIPSIVSAGGQLLLGLMQGLVQALPLMSTQLVSVVQEIVTFLVNAAPLIVQGGISLFTGLVTAIPQIIPVLIAAIPQLITGIAGALLASIPTIVDAGVQLFTGLVQNMAEIIQKIVAVLPKIISSITGFLSENAGKIAQAGYDLLAKIPAKVGEVYIKVTAAVTSIVNGIKKTLSEGISGVTQVGENLIRGLWNGISNVTGWILDKIRGFSSSVLNAIKGFFGISSPSKLLRDEVGRFLPEGLAVGIEVAAPHALKAVKGLNLAVMREMQSLKVTAPSSYQGTSAQRVASGWSQMPTQNYQGFHQSSDIHQTTNNISLHVSLDDLTPIKTVEEFITKAKQWAVVMGG